MIVCPRFVCLNNTGHGCGHIRHMRLCPDIACSNAQCATRGQSSRMCRFLRESACSLPQHTQQKKCTITMLNAVNVFTDLVPNLVPDTLHVTCTELHGEPTDNGQNVWPGRSTSHCLCDEHHGNHTPHRARTKIITILNKKNTSDEKLEFDRTAEKHYY